VEKRFAIIKPIAPSRNSTRVILTVEVA